MSKASVLVFMPAYGEQNVCKTTASLIALALDLPRHDIGFAFVTYSYFDLVRIRNLALTYWYDRTDATHLLCVDADMSFEPHVVRRMLDFDQPLVGGVYPTRSRPTTGDQRKFVGSFLQDEYPDAAGFMKVRGIGGGLMLIRRDCIDRLLEHDPSLSDDRSREQVIHGDLMKEMGLDRVITAFSYLTVHQGDVTREFGEDLSFCERARQAGMEVWGNVGDPLGHLGIHEWYGCLGKQVQPTNEVRSEPLGENPVWRLPIVQQSVVQSYPGS